MNIEDLLLSHLKSTHVKTGGHCGVLPIKLVQRTGLDQETIAMVLNKMYKEKKITVHDNVHGKIVKYKAQ